MFKLVAIAVVDRATRGPVVEGGHKSELGPRPSIDFPKHECSPKEGFLGYGGRK